MKREEMEWYTLTPDFGTYPAFNENNEIIDFECDSKFYEKSEADKVMDTMEARIKELEAENNTLKADIEVLNDDCRIAKENEVKYHKAYLNELDENARLKAQVPKWHDVSKPLYTEDGKDYYDLPGESGEYVVVYFDGQESVDRYDIDFGWDSNLEQDVYSMWCELPTAPTTDESSATEN